MMRGLLLGIAAAALPLHPDPLRAEEAADPSALVDRLAADCATFAEDDPRSLLGADGDAAQLLASPDGAMTVLNRAEAWNDLILNSFFSETRMPAGRVIACGYSLYSPVGDDAGLPGLHDELAARAAALLGGDPVEVGGEVHALGRNGRLGYWALDGLPPRASLFLTEGPMAVSVSLLKTYPPAGGN